MSIYRELEFPFSGDCICDKIDELVIVGKMLGHEVSVVKDEVPYIKEVKWVLIDINDNNGQVNYCIQFNYKKSGVYKVKIYNYSMNISDELMYSGLDSDELVNVIDKMIKDL